MGWKYFATFLVSAIVTAILLTLTGAKDSIVALRFIVAGLAGFASVIMFQDIRHYRDLRRHRSFVSLLYVSYFESRSKILADMLTEMLHERARRVQTACERISLLENRGLEGISKVERAGRDFEALRREYERQKEHAEVYFYSLYDKIKEIQPIWLISLGERKWQHYAADLQVKKREAS